MTFSSLPSLYFLRTNLSKAGFASFTASFGHRGELPSNYRACLRYNINATIAGRTYVTREVATTDELATTSS
jgi:hypothetical protein